MPERVLIISDTHLGRPHGAAVSVEALRPLWQGCARLIVNGDVAEVHHPTHWSAAARQTLQLFDLCERDGVELTILSGNHDPYITDRRHEHLADGKAFVTHGDVLHPAVAPWSPRAGRMRERHARAMESIPHEVRHRLEGLLEASQHASHGEWDEMTAEAARSSLHAMLLRPWALVQVIDYWRKIPRLAADFLKEHAPLARFGIFGHTHRDGVWTIDERVIINTGCFGFPGRPRAVVIDDDRTLEVRAIRLRRGAYAMDAAPLAAWTL